MNRYFLCSNRRIFDLETWNTQKWQLCYLRIYVHVYACRKLPRTDSLIASGPPSLSRSWVVWSSAKAVFGNLKQSEERVVVVVVLEVGASSLLSYPTTVLIHPSSWGRTKEKGESWAFSLCLLFPNSVHVNSFWKPDFERIIHSAHGRADWAKRWY